MTKLEVIELFNFLSQVYPNQFNVDTVIQEKIDVWSSLLANQNPAVVMRNAERHAMHCKFPPNIAEIREVRLESNSNAFLDKIDKWEREAVGSKY